VKNIETRLNLARKSRLLFEQEKIVENIQTTLDEFITPEDLLQALGMQEIGPATSRWILDKYGFENLPKLKAEDLEDVKGIGNVKAKHFVEQIKDRWWIVKELKSMGLNFKEMQKTDKLADKTFCITGSFDDYSREDLIDMIRKNGGEYKSSVTKDLNYLIVGKEGGSKLEKANMQKETEVISLERFLYLVS